ncbi:unnamed protein product [Effrenium voratum]|nr:unnamed protein product [Effrenium voratum]
MPKERKEPWHDNVARFRDERNGAFRRLLLKKNGLREKWRWKVWRQLLHLKAPLDAADAGSEATVDAHRRVIKEDVPRTFPDILAPEQAQQLERVLVTYAQLDPEVGYTQGMNYVAGLLLLVARDEQEVLCGFWALMQNFQLAGFYRPGFELALTYCHAVLRRMQQTMPDLHDHFLAIGIQYDLYLFPWFLRLFVTLVPLPLVKRFWDIILCEGSCAVPTLGLLVLRVLRPALLGEEDLDGINQRLRRGIEDTEGGNQRLEEADWTRLEQELSQSFESEHAWVQQILAERPPKGGYTHEFMREEFSRQRQARQDLIESMAQAAAEAQAARVEAAQAAEEVPPVPWPRGVRQSLTAPIQELSWAFC